MSGASLRNLLPSLYQVTGFLFTALATAAAILGYAAVDRVPPRIDLMGHASKKEFRQGEEFNGQRIVTVQRECSGESIRWVTKYDNPLWVMQLPTSSPHYGNIGEGPLPRRVSIAVAPFMISHNMPPGKYAYHIRGLFFCNRAQYWLQWPIVIEAPVIEFVVAPDYEHDPRREPFRGPSR